MALYIVSTPIGNIEDITLRALKILEKVDLILAEDTRRTKKLLDHYNIKKPLESFFEQNEERKLPFVLEKLKSGVEIALVSDSGTPLVSDPGFKLTRAVIKQQIKIESIPGASSVLAALTTSGLPTDQFFFLGFLPKKVGKQQEVFDLIDLVSARKPTTFIFFESPFRVKKTLANLAAIFPEKEVVVARELTKLHEEIIRVKSTGVLDKEITLKGEFVILLR